MRASSKADKLVPVRWFVPAIRQNWKLYLGSITLASLSRVSTLVDPFVFQFVIDRVIGNRDTDLLYVVIFALVAIAVFSVVVEQVSERANHALLRRLMKVYSGSLTLHLFHLPLSYFRGYKVGEISERAGEVDNAREYLSDVVREAIVDLIFVSVYLSIMFSISSELSLVVIVFLAVQIGINYLFGPKVRDGIFEQFKVTARHKSYLFESLSNILAIKSVSAEIRFARKFQDNLLKVLNSHKKVLLLGVFRRQFIFIAERLLLVAMLIVGANLVFRGNLTLGSLVAFFLVADRVAAPLSASSYIWEGWQNFKLSRARLGDILSEKPETAADDDDDLSRSSCSGGNLEFRNVSFGYDNKKLVVDELNLLVRPQTLNVIVGASGSGKSTIGKVAAGIENPTSGSVLFDNRTFDVLGLREVRRNIVYVPQEAQLFSGSILDNILIGNPSATAAMVDNALHAADAQEFISKLPNGISTQIGERGDVLSGGQRQRLAIARALVMEPKILILDEPTSMLDSASEARIASAICQLRENGSVIVITHRPEIFASADQVITVSVSF